jgi:hypothetical protein
VTEQDALAQLCAQLPKLRKSFRGPASVASRALLEQAAQAARCGEPVAPFIEQLGVGHESNVRGALPTRVHPEASRPLTGVYLCPKGTCDRVVYRATGSELPSCNVYEQALRFVADN